MIGQSEPSIGSAAFPRPKPSLFFHVPRGIRYFFPTRDAQQAASAKDLKRNPFSCGTGSPVSLTPASAQQSTNKPLLRVAAPFEALGSPNTPVPLSKSELPQVNGGSLLSSLSFRQCYKELATLDPENVARFHKGWLDKNKGSDVVARFARMDHKKLYNLEVSEVERCCIETDHALGNLRKRELQAHPEFDAVGNYRTPYPFLYSFHYMTEQLGKLPLWQDVMPFLADHPDLLLEDFHKKFDYDNSDEERRKVLDASLSWRLGIAYYSFLREIDIFVRMRKQFGVNIRYHALADIALKTDLWIGNCIISIFMGNSRYRTTSGGGRKAMSAEVFANNDDVHFLDLDLSNKIERGKVRLASEEEMKKVAQAIRRLGAA